VLLSPPPSPAGASPVPVPWVEPVWTRCGPLLLPPSHAGACGAHVGQCGGALPSFPPSLPSSPLPAALPGRDAHRNFFYSGQCAFQTAYQCVLLISTVLWLCSCTCSSLGSASFDFLNFFFLSVHSIKYYNLYNHVKSPQNFPLRGKFLPTA
jgi:hypothetical protein